MNNISDTVKSWNGIVIVLILITAALLRFSCLDADPPSTVGLHFISDEGWWVHNARNKIIFDDWIMDEFNQSLLASPTFCLSTYAIYNLYGVSYTTSRIVPVISGLLAILLLAAILRSNSSPRIATFATFLIGCNFAFTAMNRTAYVDSTALMFLLLSWWLLEKLQDRVWAVFLAGMALALAIVTKSYILSVMPPVAFVLFLRLMRQKHALELKNLFLNLLLFAGGIFSVYLLWHKYIYLPFLDEYKIMYHLWQDGNFPSTIHEFIRNIPGFFIRKAGNQLMPARFFMLNSSLVILAGFRLFQHLTANTKSLKTMWKNIPFIEQDAIIFMGILILEIAPLSAKPFRRYILLYLPLIVLASRSILTLKKTSGDHSSLGVKFLQYLTPSSCFVLLLSPFIARLLPDTFSLSLAWLIVSLTIAVTTTLAIFYLNKRSFSAMPIAIALLLVVFLDGSLHLHAAINRSYSLKNTSAQLGQKFFKPGSVVLGGIANSLCMETAAQALTIWGREEAPRVLNQDPVRRFHPDYIIILTELDGQKWGHEERYYRYVNPENFIQTIKLLPTGNSFRVIADLYFAPQSR